MEINTNNFIFVSNKQHNKLNIDFMNSYKFTIYMTRTDSDCSFLIGSQRPSYITNDRNEADAFYERQATLLHNLPQSEKQTGEITLHMICLESDIGIMREYEVKSISRALSLHSMLAIEQSL